MNELNTLLPERSEKFDVVLKKLMDAKREMGFAVKKDANNPFHKSKYATLGAHLELCESTLDKHGLILLQTVNGTIDKPILVADLCHPESGQWIKSYMPLPNPKGDSQGLGASITYMRRYSIGSMLGLSAEDDDGESACVREKPKKEVINNNMSSSDLKILEGLSKKLNSDSYKGFMSVIKERYGANSIQELPSTAYQTCITSLQAKIKLQNEMAAV